MAFLSVFYVFTAKSTHFIMTYTEHSVSGTDKPELCPPNPLPLVNRKDAQHVALYSTSWLSANRHKHTLGLITYIWPSSLTLTHWVTVSEQATTKIVSVIHPVRPSAVLSHTRLTAVWSTHNEDSLLCDASHEIQSSLYYCLYKFVIQHFLMVQFSAANWTMRISFLFFNHRRHFSDRN